MLLLAEGPDQAFSSSTFFYPVGPLVSRLASAHAKKALEQFKALVLSVSARVWLKPDLGCRVGSQRGEYLCGADISQSRSAECWCQALLETVCVGRPTCDVADAAFACLG